MNDTVVFEDGVPVLAVTMNQRPYVDHVVFVPHPTVSQIQKLMNVQLVGRFLEFESDYRVHTVKQTVFETQPSEDTSSRNQSALLSEYNSKKSKLFEGANQNWQVFERCNGTGMSNLIAGVDRIVNKLEFIQKINYTSDNPYWKDLLMLKHNVSNENQLLKTFKYMFRIGRFY